MKFLVVNHIVKEDINLDILSENLQKSRNNKYIPFDFMYYLIIFFRKLFRKEKGIIVIENKI